jgi:4,5-dihydroxyphthalate decarboxylase
MSRCPLLPLTIATARYDRTIPLHDGRVRPEGLDITWLRLNVEQIFWRQLRHLEFDASELSMSSLLIRRGRGVDDLVPIPVFLSRTFRHSCVYVNADAGITQPEDLVGKRVGVPEYQMTAAVWARGILEDDFGVRPESVEWFQGGLEQPGRLPQEPVSPHGVSISMIPAGATLAAMIASGEIDALVTPRIPTTFHGGSGPVRRLFADPWTVERDYWERTRIFPIMHTVAIKRTLVDANPWLPQTLANAFTEAKRLADADLRDTTALRIGLPFLVQHAEDTVRLMGEDFWPYGVESNRATLETLTRYLHRQGLIPERPEIDDIFPASTRVVSRV